LECYAMMHTNFLYVILFSMCKRGASFSITVITVTEPGLFTSRAFYTGDRRPAHRKTITSLTTLNENNAALR